jgi:hypothetical protein
MTKMASASLSSYAPASQFLNNRTTLLDTLAVTNDVLLPTLAKGVIIRRPMMLSLAERLNLDRRAIRRLQQIRHKYGSGPLLLRIPGRRVALILDPEHVGRILNESPEPFATATKEKIAALAHFEPKGVLISRGPERAERRCFNEEVLDTSRLMHRLADSFVETVDREAARLCQSLGNHKELGWHEFSGAWFRIVRRIVFGESANEDHELSSTMATLRSSANWAFLAPQRVRLRNRLLNRIESYIRLADPTSLAGIIAHTHLSPMTAPSQQVPQWLFAFDAAGITTFRSLALLASHTKHGLRVREEIETHRGAARRQLPYLRSVVLESLRLWPTTPLILRESTSETTWETGVLPANTELLIFAPFFHRDDEHLPYADTFMPELWKNDESQQSWPIISFSGGPAACPGRPLVLLLASAMIAAILDNARLRLKNRGRLRPDLPLPATLNHFNLKFELRVPAR